MKIDENIQNLGIEFDYSKCYNFCKKCVICFCIRIVLTITFDTLFGVWISSNLSGAFIYSLLFGIPLHMNIITELSFIFWISLVFFISRTLF